MSADQKFRAITGWAGNLIGFSEFGFDSQSTDYGMVPSPPLQIPRYRTGRSRFTERSSHVAASSGSAGGRISIMPPARRPLAERFWTKVVKHEGEHTCWEWTSTINEHGYGVVGRGGKNGGMSLAHRVSWKFHFGPVPADLCVLHRCDNPKCVRPGHLFLGTRADNNADMVAKGRAVHYGFIGVANPIAKLTDADVREIRRIYAQGGITQSQIALKHGVHHSLISLVVRRKAWVHVLP